ncbi:hypothetical protein HLRTI_000495 [Halorhabdus tiamatea SARL4B]|uniref:Uncharacterized protein n=1 Tax=Halorhabdus tiamatea SARL4B TaxID=1033806 RepID=F7PLQ3_9EURY|nr:hypothetical protein HLRTI_000495 [Halorhabdus tiamatea SARL4B]
MDEAEHCECCGSDSELQEGYWVVDGRLYRDALCDHCRDNSVQEFAGLLLNLPVIDLSMARKAVRAFLTCPDQREPSDPATVETYEHALEEIKLSEDQKAAILNTLDPAEIRDGVETH